MNERMSEWVNGNGGSDSAEESGRGKDGKRKREGGKKERKKRKERRWGASPLQYFFFNLAHCIKTKYVERSLLQQFCSNDNSAYHDVTTNRNVLAWLAALPTGAQRFYDDIRIMTGKRPTMCWCICLRFLTPATLLVSSPHSCSVETIRTLRGFVVLFSQLYHVAVVMCWCYNVAYCWCIGYGHRLLAFLDYLCVLLFRSVFSVNLLYNSNYSICWNLSVDRLYIVDRIVSNKQIT